MNNSKVQEDFLLALRGITSTVNVISAKLNGERHAMTATSVASLSLSPPAMIICVNKEAAIHCMIKERTTFCINVLSHLQKELSEVCSNFEEGETRFEDEGWIDQTDLIYNSNSVSNIICLCTKAVDYSTHSVFFGEVIKVNNNNQNKALLYSSGEYLVD
tara:strand:+ start:1168 stop:1647 length:480 start_codon:yes stop_codon:yes gene_type:complete